MRRRYEFKFNTPKPSRQDIEKHKNFDALLESYRQAPASRRRFLTPRRLSLAGLALAAGLTGWFLLTGLPLFQSYEEQATAFFAAQPLIDPPFPQQIQKEFVQHSLDANAGGVLEGQNGTRIHVPSDVFQDESGNAVSGEVQIRYREMHDVVDFFLAGIPMAYDSAGAEYQLESAGMMEIYAQQNGKRLQIRPGRSIEVELVSEVTLESTADLTEFNIYRLDTVERNWVYEDVNQMMILETYFPGLPEDHPLCAVQESFQMELAALESAERLALSQLEEELALPAPPLRPQRHNGTDFVFDFDLSALLRNPQAHSLNPEQLQLLREGTLWQLHPTENIDRSSLAQQWEDVQIAPINNRDFRLTLIKGAQQVSVVVNPVLSGSSYDRALAQYQTAMETYDRAVRRRKEQLEMRGDSIHQYYASVREQLDAKYDARWAEANTVHPPIRHKVISRFLATQLGIWNCDRPVEAKLAEVQARFEDEYGSALRNRVGYLVDNTRNTITRFYTGRMAKLPIDPGADQQIWMVTDKRKLAVYRPGPAQQTDHSDTTTGDDQTIVMDIVDRPLRNEWDVREALYSSL